MVDVVRRWPLQKVDIILNRHKKSPHQNSVIIRSAINENINDNFGYPHMVNRSLVFVLRFLNKSCCELCIFDLEKQIFAPLLEILHLVVHWASRYRNVPYSIISQDEQLRVARNRFYVARVTHAPWRTSMEDTRRQAGFKFACYFDIRYRIFAHIQLHSFTSVYILILLC